MHIDAVGKSAWLALVRACGLVSRYRVTSADQGFRHCIAKRGLFPSSVNLSCARAEVFAKVISHVSDDRSGDELGQVMR